MDEQLLRLAIQAMDDGDFEKLVNELAQAALKAEGRQVRKMRAPDGGAVAQPQWSHARFTTWTPSPGS